VKHIKGHQGNFKEMIIRYMYVQSDQKENKPEEALQIIIGHVVAEYYVNKRSMRGRRQFVVTNATSLILDVGIIIVHFIIII
jgi:G:T-mismatch repair DNA endonuclease (very short patch repair protein)